MEAHTISTFRTWNAKQNAEIKKRKDALTAELKALIPYVLKDWTEEG